MKSKTLWGWAWSVWLVAVVSSFGWLEWVALGKRSHPTLSRTLAYWMGVNPRTRRGKVLPIAFLGFWTWLTVHVVRYKVMDGG